MENNEIWPRKIKSDTGGMMRYVKSSKEEPWGLATTRFAWLRLPDKQTLIKKRCGKAELHLTMGELHWYLHSISLLFAFHQHYCMLKHEWSSVQEITAVSSNLWFQKHPDQLLNPTANWYLEHRHQNQLGPGNSENSKMDRYLQQKFLSNKEVMNDSDRHENYKRNNPSVFCTVLASGYPSQAPIFASFDAMWAARHLCHLRKGSRNPSWWYQMMNLQNIYLHHLKHI